jgi:hypothetical protein
MNQFDDILKNKLEQEKIPVNPGHLASFESMLDQRNRKRRGVLPWILGLVFIGLAVSVFLWKPWVEENTDALIVAESVTASVIDVPSVTLNTEQKWRELLPETRLSDHTNDDIESATIDEMVTHSPSTRSFNQAQQLQSKAQFKNASLTHPGNAISKLANEKNESQKRETDYRTQKIESNRKPKEETPLFTQSKTEESNQTFTSSDEAMSESEKRDLSWNATIAIIPSLQPGVNSSASLAPQIFIPAYYLPNRPLRKNEAGFMGSVGYLSESYDQAVSQAYQVQFGGYVQRRISNRLSMGVNGGFLYNRAGLDFSKTSAVEQFGFGLRSTVNTLNLKKAFFVFGGVDIQYRLKRHVITGGLQVKYLYGAQGSIARFVEDDFGMKEEELLDHIWLKTDGIRRLSMDGLVGYGYQISPRVSIFIQGRLPLVSTTTDRSQELYQGDYIIKSSKQNIMPELSLRYSIFRF